MRTYLLLDHINRTYAIYQTAHDQTRDIFKYRLRQDIDIHFARSMSDARRIITEATEGNTWKYVDYELMYKKGGRAINEVDVNLDTLARNLYADSVRFGLDTVMPQINDWTITPDSSNTTI